jgi:hypothetical protein
MSTATAPALAAQIESLAQAAGLVLTGTDAVTSFDGRAVTRFWLALPADTMKPFSLELTDDFAADEAQFHAALTTYLGEWAVRLRNPRPDAYLTLLGLPVSFANFAWPFHASTSGADTFIVHGDLWLETGEEHTLHAKVSASLTRTFAEVVPALQQPFAESFIFNAVRKTLDQGQLELVKSGNRQPVPVTTRYYSAKQQRFSFNDTDEPQRIAYMTAMVYWLSGVLGGGRPVWIADPRDAQYLNTSVEVLQQTAAKIAAGGLIQLHDNFAAATASLLDHKPQYDGEVAEALSFIKPSFNEEMRAGHTNM